MAAKVFISYSHDSDLHRRRISDLAAQLRTHQLDVTIDEDKLPGGPNEGWEHWCEAQVRTADKVLIVCTERYTARYLGTEAPGIGLGAIAEARLIHRILFNAAGINPKFRAILFEPSDAPHVPDTLQSYRQFHLYRPTATADLIAWLQTTDTAPADLTSKPSPILWPPPLATPHLWDMANRENITARLEEILSGRSPQHILLLSAASNSGKTHLLAQLKAYAKALQMPHAHLDCKGDLPLDDLINLIALDLQHHLVTTHAAPTDRRRTSLIADLQHLTQPVLLTFDTYEQASLPAKHWIESQFLPRLDAMTSVVAVLAGQQIPDRAKHPWANLAAEMKLEAILNPSAWLEYTKRKWHSNVSHDHVQALTLATNGNPGAVSALLENMMSGLQKSGATA